MRHWKLKEEADYYESLSREQWESAVYAANDALSLPSEARLSVKDNVLQIEEIKYGHKEEHGTEFRPFYPD